MHNCLCIYGSLGGASEMTLNGWLGTHFTMIMNDVQCTIVDIYMAHWALRVRWYRMADWENSLQWSWKMCNAQLLIYMPHWAVRVRWDWTADWENSLQWPWMMCDAQFLINIAHRAVRVRWHWTADWENSLQWSWMMCDAQLLIYFWLTGRCGWDDIEQLIGKTVYNDHGWCAMHNCW